MNHLAINPESVVPLYYQIRQELLARIQAGDLKVGEVIPSEQEIASRFGVSRMTAREAVKSLRGLGVAYSLRGKGTFVSDFKLEKNVRRVQSFTEEMESLGHRPRSKPLEVRELSAPPDVARGLGLAPAERVIYLRRLRLADSIPMGIEGAYLPYRLCPEFLTSYDPQTSLYTFLWERYGLRATLADETIEAGLSSLEESRLLRIPNKSPVFMFTRISYVRQHQAVEYVKSTYRADRYKIVHRLRRVDLESPGKIGGL